uniref:Metalloendopeptidase n=1 Tax=Strigops habroptila TaxID=2489341 RepID=A0A672TRZ1_STRHB
QQIRILFTLISFLCDKVLSCLLYPSLLYILCIPLVCEMYSKYFGVRTVTISYVKLTVNLEINILHEFNIHDKNSTVYEGDILLRRGRRSAINCESCLWPKSQDGKLSPGLFLAMTERSWIADALQEISTLTCVQFVNRTTEKDYVYVERGCWSYFGKIGGRQAVGLVKNGCMDKGAIQHEMNHALGFIHEQTRSDRDRFVKIMWEHIVAEQGNFGKVNSKNLGLPYDYSSVMHYGAYDFSSTPGKQTIVPVPDPSIPIGQREGLSNLDVAKINRLYKCSKCCLFSSVNYPSPYPNNSNCLWLIRIRQSKIFLQFEAFDLQLSSDCSSDYIKVYNGNSKNSPVLLDKYCGKGPLPSLVASGSTMLVEFASDESITATGFRASYNRGTNTPLQSLRNVSFLLFLHSRQQ